MVNGFWTSDGSNVCIINVYAPCSSAERSEVWDLISMVVNQYSDSCICILGDFNAIRYENERVGSGENVDSRDMSCFDNFIRQSNLIDLPLVGRTFTWYKADGSCKSKLDRILVNDVWNDKWPQLVLKGGGRSVSDHIPIFLECSIRDWGPKPFKFMNSWMQHPNFQVFVKSKWQSYNILGWGGFVLKEKLKLLKNDLKEWNRVVFGYVDSVIADKKMRIESLDRIDDAIGLDEEEIIERNQVSAELLRTLNWKEAILYQKVKTRWLREGDTNSSFFHSWINRRAK